MRKLWINDCVFIGLNLCIRCKVRVTLVNFGNFSAPSHISAYGQSKNNVAIYFIHTTYVSLILTLFLQAHTLYLKMYKYMSCIFTIFSAMVLFYQHMDRALDDIVYFIYLFIFKCCHVIFYLSNFSLLFISHSIHFYLLHYFPIYTYVWVSIRGCIVTYIRERWIKM